MNRAILAICALATTMTGQAHLMEAQHATLNFVEDGAFLVVSLPVTAFSDVDDDSDGRLSQSELTRNFATIEQQVNDGVQLLDEVGQALPLRGLMLSLSPPHDDPNGPARQVLALGRFSLVDNPASVILQVRLRGDRAEEQVIELIAKRAGRSQKLVFTPEIERYELVLAE